MSGPILPMATRGIGRGRSAAGVYSNREGGVGVVLSDLCGWMSGARWLQSNYRTGFPERPCTTFLSPKT
jgi:hypothetical protein